MKTAVKNKKYEAMFLVDAAEADADWQSVESSVRKILGRVDAEIISLRRWDTRRLAYEIDRKSRGTYILCYFRADGGRIAEIERTAQLSERIMRLLILSAEHVTQEAMEKDTPAILAERQPEAVGEEVAVEAEAVSARAGEASGPEDAGAEEDSKAEAVAVSGETAEGGDEPAKGRRRRSKAGEAAAEASEPEQSAGDESAEAEGSDQEKSEEAGQ